MGGISPGATASGVGGVVPTFLLMYEHKGGEEWFTFGQKCMNTRGGTTPQEEAAMNARCWKCINDRGGVDVKCMHCGGHPCQKPMVT